MSSFSLSGGVEVTGFISPTDTNDTYPVIDPLYGIDGFRNVNLITELNTIPEPRRRAGMVVGVSGGTQYYKLKSSPWNGTQSDWELFSLGSTFEGGIVTGNTIFTQGVTATTFSASTYLGLPLDGYVTGGTYNDGTLTLVNNTGGTIDVTGFYTGGTITGDTTIDGILTINGELISDNFSGTTNYIPKFTPNSYSIGNSIITNNSNNVSIGTISTPYRFYVLGNNTTAGQPLFVVRDTGRIGIRTTSPLAELSIENSNPTLSQDIITLRNNGSGIGTGNSIRFINSTNLNSTVGSKIESTITNLSGRNTLKFFIHGGGGIFGGLQERMSLDGTGSLFVNNLNANVISGNTYLNLPVTTDTFVTGFSYNNANTFTISDNSGNTFNSTINTVTGLTVNGSISATTYQNLPTDIRVTGGTYSNGTTIFTNNTGGTFNVTGFYTGASDNDRYVTGFTYNNNTFTISDNSGSTFNSTFNTVTGLTVNGNLSVTGNTTVKGITGTTALFSGSGQSILTIVGSGTTLPLFSIVGSSGELFSVTDSLVGSLFSVNDISGLPILEVFSDSTVIIGDYLSPSLNTTKRVSAGIGTTTIYSIPISAYTGAFFDYTVSDGTNLRAGNIMSIWSGTSINYTETSTTSLGSTTGITFNMVISGGTSAVLQTSGTTAGWTVKTIIRSI